MTDTDEVAREVECDAPEEEEEEVELFSTSGEGGLSRTDSVTPSGSSDRAAPTLSPRRCISKELLDQMPSLSTSARYFEADVLQPFGVFNLMQLIEKSIQVGALFTPKLYVPKEVWQQDQVKLAGVPLKVETFVLLKHGFEKASMSFPLVTPEAKEAFAKELDALLEAAKMQRVVLARSFPFLAAEKTPQPAGAAKTEPPSSSGIASGGIGKLTNLAYGFGRMVKKQAIAAVERVGAAQAVALPFHELEEYAAMMCAFFNSTRSIEHLVGVKPVADGTEEQVNAVDDRPQLSQPTLDKLKELAIFLDEVIMELVMRDLQALLDTSLRRTTRFFGEFTIEQAIMKRRGSITA